MGVQGLWSLLEPVGRRILVESLANKTLAIDASIWLTQFIKAMRDDRGDVVRNAHLLGFFRRILRLLFHRIRPVFVFDGATPMLKRRTTIMRRRLREKQTAKLRKTAEKLLINQLKSNALTQLQTGELETDAAAATANTATPTAPTAMAPPSQATEQPTQAASGSGLRAEDKASDSTPVDAIGTITGERMLVPAPAKANDPDWEAEVEDEEDEEEEDYDLLAMLPEDTNNVDPEVMAHLPASIQLELLGKIREQRVYENRATFQKSANNPDEFSKTQMSSYLKSCEFKRKVQTVIKDMNRAEGEHGHQTHRVTGEEHSEYIFVKDSSSANNLRTTRNSGGRPGAVVPSSVSAGKQAFGSHKEKPPFLAAPLQLAAPPVQMLSSAPHPVLPPPTGALGSGALDTAPTLALPPSNQSGKAEGGEALNICFDVEASEHGSGDDEDMWEDVGTDPAPEDNTHGNNDPATGAASDGEWEDANLAMQEVKTNSRRSSQEIIPTSASKDELPKWKQKYLERKEKWSRSHGFTLGRKLDTWEDDTEDLDEGPPEGDTAGNTDLAEEEAVQRAIQYSLMEGHPGESSRAPPSSSQASSSRAGASKAAVVYLDHSDDESPKLVTKRGEASSSRACSSGMNMPSMPQREASTSLENPDAMDEDPSLQEAIRLSLAQQSGQAAQPPQTTKQKEEAAHSPGVDVRIMQAEVTVVKEGCKIKIDVGEFVHAADNIDDQWPEWLPYPEDLDEEPVTVLCGDREWLLECPVGPTMDAIASEMMVVATERAAQIAGDDNQEHQPKPGLGLPKKDEDAENVGNNTGSSAVLVDLVEEDEEKPKPANQSMPMGTACAITVIEHVEPATLSTPLGIPMVPSMKKKTAAPLAVPPGMSQHNQLNEGPEQGNVQQINITPHASIPEGTSPSRSSPVADGQPRDQASPEEEMGQLDGAPHSPPKRQPAALDVAARAVSGEQESAELSVPVGLEHARDRNSPSPSPTAVNENSIREIRFDRGPEAVAVSSNEATGHSRMATEEEERWLEQQDAEEELMRRERLERERQETIADMQQELEAERQALQADRRQQTRNAETPTNEMYTECQELLQLFGIPYIIAPQEAEAQCAYLNEHKLVDGVVTDDSDVFLFGGTHIYKNIFENQKYVESYNMSDIERDLGLNKQRLILLALLLGSDYTEGVAGVGIVNAMEIVQAFGTLEDLKIFKQWVENPDVAELLSKAKGNSKGKQGKGKAPPSSNDAQPTTTEGAEPASADGEEESPDEFSTIDRFMAKHKNIRKNWELPESFPSSLVQEAYADAQVDKSKEKFQWGCPDKELLQRFCRDKFDWTNHKVDELLDPVITIWQKRESQMRLDQFFPTQRVAVFKSKRLQDAVAKVSGKRNADLALGAADRTTAPKKAVKKRGPTVAESAAGSPADMAAVVETKGSGGSRRGRAGGRGRGRSSGRGKQQQTEDAEGGVISLVGDGSDDPSGGAPAEGETRMLAIEAGGAHTSVAERINIESQAALQRAAASRQNRASRRQPAEAVAVDLASTDNEAVSDGGDADYEVLEDATDIIQRRRRLQH